MWAACEGQREAVADHSQAKGHTSFAPTAAGHGNQGCDLRPRCDQACESLCGEEAVHGQAEGITFSRRQVQAQQFIRVYRLRGGFGRL